MNKFINCHQFTKLLFDDDKASIKGSRIIHAILKAKSPRLSEISQHMSGNPIANYKMIQRFLEQNDPMSSLLRLYQEDAPFVIGDPTEIERPHARKTTYVGTLKDGKTAGFWLLMLSTPYRGRSIPFSFVTYSSSTIANEANSRNLMHYEAILWLKNMLGEKPIVLDREFSYGQLLENMTAAQIHYVIRLRMGSKPPIFINEEGRRIKPRIAQNGKSVTYRQLYYQGKVAVNLIGIWKQGHRKPLWVMTDLEPEQGLRIYKARFKIEESFRDLKSLLHLNKIMNKSQSKMEKMVAMVLIAYTIGVLVGEAIRDKLFPYEKGNREKPSKCNKQRYLYSGLFLLLKWKKTLAARELRKIIQAVLIYFTELVLGDVRTFV